MRGERRREGSVERGESSGEERREGRREEGRGGRERG